MTDEQPQDDDVVDESAALGPETVAKPTDWGKALYAAYLYQVVETMKQAAAFAGVSYRTMQRWVHSEWWPEAEAQAYHRFLRHTDSQARRALARALTNGETDVMKWYLERRDPNFAPPTKRLDVRMSVQQLIASLPADEVRRLRELPEDQRREELQKLLGPGGMIDD